MTRLNLTNSRKIILICNAITNNQLIRFVYNGKERLAEPYIIGQHTTTQNFLIRAWECNDGVLEKTEENRKLFNITKIEQLSLETSPFIPRTDKFSFVDKHISRPLCSLFSGVMPAMA